MKPDRVVFNALITACGESGAVDRAFDVLAEMRAEVHPIDPDHVTVGALMKACGKAGQVCKFVLSFERKFYRILIIHCWFGLVLNLPLCCFWFAVVDKSPSRLIGLMKYTK